MEPWSFNLRHIRAFVKTCELGTLLTASKTVHMSQPAMTQAIARLENQMDMSLFDRQSDGMQPTETALTLVPRLKAFLGFIRSARITHTQIRAFLALARGGSYSEAHKTTGLARASLHRAVSDLEAALDQELVRRRGRGLEITETGRLAAKRFSLAEAEMRSAIEDIEIIRGKAAGRVAIGAMPLSRARVLPEAIVAYQRKARDCEIYVSEASHAELIEPLRNGNLDFLIGALREQSPGLDLVQSPLFEDCPVVFARNDHPLSGCLDNDLEALSQYPWCLPPKGVPLRDSWEQMFVSAGLNAPGVHVECGSASTLRQILMQTDYLTVLSPDQVAAELQANWVKVVGKTSEEMRRTIGLTYRENWRPTQAQREFMQILRRVT